MGELLTIAEVARVLGAPKPTIRNWTREFGQAFSDYAKPDRGSVRRYTPEDVRVLAYIRRARHDERSLPTIHEDLTLRKHRDMELPDLAAAEVKSARRKRGSRTAMSSDQADLALSIMQGQHRQEVERLKEENHALQRRIETMQVELNQLRERAARAEGQLSAFRQTVRRHKEE
ncbi:MAG: helix-turn-helix domain-containing protein [Chloroflexi bacterium]|nr:helix-turn-helix domain-containing protein [Chloroflexota bacterium]